MTVALSVPCMSPTVVRAARRTRTARRRGTKVSFVADRTLVIKVTAGKDDPERCNQAFTVAATAIASGVTVSLWLTGEASWFAIPGRAEEFSLPHAAPLIDMLALVIADGTVTVCTQCAARRDITQDDLIPGIQIAGAPTFVAEIMTEGAQALVYLARAASAACAAGCVVLDVTSSTL
jgi:predicted peroxiredoxin